MQRFANVALIWLRTHTPTTCSWRYDHEWLKADYKPDSSILIWLRDYSGGMVDSYDSTTIGVNLLDGFRENTSYGWVATTTALPLHIQRDLKSNITEGDNRTSNGEIQCTEYSVHFIQSTHKMHNPPYAR